MTKINELTAEQKALLPVWRDKWLKIGLSTDPIDQERAKSAVRKMYECAGLEAPNTFVFLDNPEHGAIVCPPVNTPIPAFAHKGDTHAESYCKPR